MSVNPHGPIALTPCPFRHYCPERCLIVSFRCVTSFLAPFSVVCYLPEAPRPCSTTVVFNIPSLGGVAVCSPDDPCTAGKEFSSRKCWVGNMASRQYVQSLVEEAVCPVCLDFFTNPVTLDCGHNFCLSCITQSWEKGGRNYCPECRAKFSDRSLRINWALTSLAEKAQKLNLNRKETEMRSQCEKHREELKLFCDTDKQLVCLICRDAREHRSHNFMPIEEAVEIYKCQVKSSFESLTEKKSAIQDLEQRQKQKISGVREQSHSLQANVTSEFAKIHQVLAEREQRLLNDLRAEEEKILNTMEKNLQEIEENLTSAEEKLSKLQEQMNEEDSVMFLKFMRPLMWKQPA